MHTREDSDIAVGDRPLDERTCVDSARDALVALDAAGHVVVWSAAAERMYGWPASEVIGRPLPWRDGEHRGAEHLQLHELARRGVVVGAVPVETSRRNGSTVVAEVSIDPVRAADGHIIGTCSIHRDITMRTPSIPIADRTEDLDLVGAEQAEAAGAAPGFDGLCARRGLSEFDRDLVALLLTGHRIPAIARTLGRSPGTIRNRLSLLYRRFGVRGQAELLDELHAELGDAISIPMGA
jgi:PAS domain S-box-containing protein